MKLEMYFADWARALRTSFFDLASCILLSKSCYEGKSINLELNYTENSLRLKIQALSNSQVENGQKLNQGPQKFSPEHNS